MSAGPPEGIDGVELECVGSDVGPLWFPVTDDVMRPYIADRGTWEATEGELLSQFFRPGLRFLDVGANVGYFSRFVLRHCPDAQVDACEPHPFTYRLLRLNLWQAGGLARTWPTALGAGERIAALSTSASNLGDTRSCMQHLEGTHSDLVAPSIAADELFSGQVFDLVKIDVQGAEPQVIAGMRDLIDRSRGIAIVAEFWPTSLRAAGVDPLGVLAQYRAMGLRIVTQVGRRLSVLPAAETVEICDSGGPDGQVNLLLVHE